MNDSSSKFEWVLPNLGWFAAALVVAWFFIFARPASFAEGFTQGLADQNTMDKQTYELATGLTENPTIGTSTSLRVVRVQTGSIIADTLLFSETNPFGTASERKTVVFTAQTPIVKRLIISPDEFASRIKAVQDKGGNTLMIMPYDDVPATIADINPGDRIEVDVIDANTLQSPSFLAQMIAIVQAAEPQK